MQTCQRDIQFQISQNVLAERLPQDVQVTVSIEIRLCIQKIWNKENRVDGCGSHWPLQTKMCFFYPKIWIFGGQKSICCMVIAIFVYRAYHQYTPDYNFPIRTNPKQNSVSELLVIFRGSHLFFAVLGHSHFTITSTFNFGPFSTKLGGNVRAI